MLFGVELLGVEPALDGVKEPLLDVVEGAARGSCSGVAGVASFGVACFGVTGREVGLDIVGVHGVFAPDGSNSVLTEI